MTLQVVTANRLRDGLVVYLAEGGWVEEVGRAQVADNDEAAKALLAAGERAVAERVVVAPYLIDVKSEGGRVTPTRYREVLRALGPSTPSGVRAAGRGDRRTKVTSMRTIFRCHAREGGHPGGRTRNLPWTPAFAGVTAFCASGTCELPGDRQV